MGETTLKKTLHYHMSYLPLLSSSNYLHCTPLILSSDPLLLSCRSSNLCSKFLQSANVYTYITIHHIISTNSGTYILSLPQNPFHIYVMYIEILISKCTIYRQNKRLYSINYMQCMIETQISFFTLCDGVHDSFSIFVSFSLFYPLTQDQESLLPYIDV